MKKKRIKLGTKRRMKCDHCRKRRVCIWSEAYYDEVQYGFAWFCRETPEG